VLMTFAVAFDGISLKFILLSWLSYVSITWSNVLFALPSIVLVF
jgi:hypothetical protein